MTPLHLEILLWYYARMSDYRFNGNEPSLEYARHLVSDGILVETGGAFKYSVTPKGRFWVEYVLALPWPKQQWAMMPTLDEQWTGGV